MPDITPDSDHGMSDDDWYYEIAHTGWSCGGWSEDDPTPEEAMRALAALQPHPAEEQ